MRHTAMHAVLCLVFSGLACSTLAAEPEPAPTARAAPEPAAGADATPLRGPDVPEAEVRSLVEKTMTGRLRRLEVRPEIAALQKLRLDGDAATKARAIVSARAEAVTMMLVDELDGVAAITERQERGDRDGAERILAEMWEAFEPGRPLAPLADELAGVLTDEQAASMRRLVDDYWEAWVDWELRNNERRSNDERAREQTAQRLAFGLFRREVRRAYEHSLRRYREAIVGIDEAVGPTDEQASEIRSIIIGHIKETRLHATPEERRAVHMRIYRLLDEERREKLFAYMTEAVIRD